MNAREVSEAVVAWARAELADLRAGYPYPIFDSGALPDLVVVTQAIRTVPSDPENFPFELLEQVWLKVFDVELSIGVEQADGAKGAQEAHQALEGYAETLMGSAIDDATLGSRVPMVSPRVEADLAEPFKERKDGTRVRELYMKFVVAEPLEVEP